MLSLFHSLRRLLHCEKGFLRPATLFHIKFPGLLMNMGQIAAFDFAPRSLNKKIIKEISFSVFYS